MLECRKYWEHDFTDYHRKIRIIIFLAIQKIGDSKYLLKKIVDKTGYYTAIDLSVDENDCFKI